MISASRIGKVDFARPPLACERWDLFELSVQKVLGGMGVWIVILGVIKL